MMEILPAISFMAVHGLSHGLARFPGVAGGLDGNGLGLAGVIGVLADAGGHLFHGRGGFLDGRGLFGGAWERDSAEALISSEPEATFSAPDWTSPTTSRSRSIISAMPRSSTSLSERTVTDTVRIALGHLGGDVPRPGVRPRSCAPWPQELADLVGADMSDVHIEIAVGHGFGHGGWPWQSRG